MPSLTFGTPTKQQSGVFHTVFLPVCIPAARQVGAQSPVRISSPASKSSWSASSDMIIDWPSGVPHSLLGGAMSRKGNTASD